MNATSTLIARLIPYLQSNLRSMGYTDLEVRAGIWNPRTLLPWDRYLIFLAIPTANPSNESRIQSSKLVTETLRTNVVLLVKNYDETNSVLGDTAPNLGVFQMLKDAKTVLRDTDLDGLVERTYREVEGGTAFETGVSGGFESQAHGWVHRLSFIYTAAMFPFCHPA